jgi:hypothetical protein
MKIFPCQACGQILYFENTVCVSCGRRLGYLPSLTCLSALEVAGEGWRAHADPATLSRFCANEGGALHAGAATPDSHQGHY